MIGWKRRVLLKDYLEQGMTKTAVAEKFGVSRRTVYHSPSFSGQKCSQRGS